VSNRLVIDVEGLVGHPEATREFSAVQPVSLRVGEARTTGPMSVEGVVAGTVNGVIATFEVSAPVHMACSRCLVEWDDVVDTSGSQHFSRVPDEDGYAIVDRVVDVAGPASDELAFAFPAAPVCREDCRGLCPICGNDLNTDPCDGHGEESDSPFAALKDLFDT